MIMNQCVLFRCLVKKKQVMLSDYLPHLFSHAVMFADNYTHLQKSIKFLEEKIIMTKGIGETGFHAIVPDAGEPHVVTV